MKVLKFGGKSLANGTALEGALNIIEQIASHTPICVVVSARGESTDKLIELYELALANKNFTKKLDEFFTYQAASAPLALLLAAKKELTELLQAIQLLRVDTDKILSRVVAFGEVLSSQTIAHLLAQKGINSIAIDARNFISLLPNKLINEEESSRKILNYFDILPAESVPIITGYIARDSEGDSSNLGRNGSNYTATLLAKFLNANEVQNWTDIDGVYTANPKIVKAAKKITCLSYREANELANFGTSIIHAKTIVPLIESGIPLKILNSFRPQQSGTLINQQGAKQGVKAISTIEDVSLISIEGNGLLHNVGIDGRIFSALGKNNISVRLIAQASSERNIGFVINDKDTQLAINVLEQEFEREIQRADIKKITANTAIAIIAIIGRHNYALEKAISVLRENKIWMHLITNSMSGEHISLVIDKEHLHKAVNEIYNIVFS